MENAPDPVRPARRRVVIVEDQTAIREMLAMYVASLPDFEVAGEAASTGEAARIVAAVRPDLVILDWLLLGGNGADFLAALRDRRQSLHVLVFSGCTGVVSVREALLGGARGYIEKSASFAEFTIALRAVAEGGAYFGPAIAQVVTRLTTPLEPVERQKTLTDRELDVLRLLGGGLLTKEIADRLGISARTVETHRASVTRKTGLRSVAQLTLHALALGLLNVEAESMSASAS